MEWAFATFFGPVFLLLWQMIWFITQNKTNILVTCYIFRNQIGEEPVNYLDIRICFYIYHGDTFLNDSRGHATLLKHSIVSCCCAVRITIGNRRCTSMEINTNLISRSHHRHFWIESSVWKCLRMEYTLNKSVLISSFFLI